jgi:hypothetical protein
MSQRGAFALLSASSRLARFSLGLPTDVTPRRKTSKQ